MHASMDTLSSDQLVEGLTQVIIDVEAVAACEMARGIGRSRRVYAEWARRAWRKNPGRLGALAQILQHCKKVQAWPLQLTATLSALAPKPSGEGDHVLGMAPLVVKLWSRARQTFTSQWCSKRAALWDLAIRGSSAIRAALLRATPDDAAQEQDLSFLVLLLDIEKCYDNVSLVGLLRIGLDFGFSPTAMGLEVKVYLRPRYLRERGWISEAIFPARSIVAGSSHGAPFSKLALYPILERVHQAAPSAGLWTFTDTNGRCEGTAKSALAIMDIIGTTLEQGQRQSRSVVSWTSVLVGSTPQLARIAAGRLRARGVPVREAKSGVDPHVDCAAARRRGSAKALIGRSTTTGWQDPEAPAL
ncbi:unnamed protein product, partial [Prorocentrum cordatum]